MGEPLVEMRIFQSGIRASWLELEWDASGHRDLGKRDKVALRRRHGECIQGEMVYAAPFKRR
jgi:hypothetical protein